MKAKKKERESVFTKKQLGSSVAYRDKRDILEAILEPGKSYTRHQAESLADKFLKGRVK